MCSVLLVDMGDDLALCSLLPLLTKVNLRLGEIKFSRKKKPYNHLVVTEEN